MLSCVPTVSNGNGVLIVLNVLQNNKNNVIRTSVDGDLVLCDVNAGGGPRGSEKKSCV